MLMAFLTADLLGEGQHDGIHPYCESSGNAQEANMGILDIMRRELLLSFFRLGETPE
jgi:hypothetical protein